MFERRRARKRMKEAESLSASTPDGTLVRVTGTVRKLDMHLLAPTTGRPCVAFSIRVYEPSQHEPGGMGQSAPFDYVELVPFAIENEELGRVVIDSQFADLLVPEHRAERLSDQHWTDFCDARALSPSSTGTERPIMNGDIVTVLGTSARRATPPGKEAGFRESPTQLCLVGDFDHPLLIIDEAIED